MKNIIKKAFIFVFTLALLFTCFAYAKANATEVTTSSEIQVLGAGLRTTGSVAIRFQASIGNYEAPSGRSIVKYGMLFAYGESESFLKGDTVNDLEVLSCEVTELDEDNIYYVSIANIPSEEYVQNVSTRAYVVLDNDELVYGETSLTRNAAEVAITANNDDIKSEIIDTVIQSVISEYYVVENTNSLKEIVVSPINTFTYTKDDIELLWGEFVADWNYVTGSELSLTATASEFYASLRYSTESAAKDYFNIPESSKIATFFSGYMLTKWQWLLNSLAINSHPKNQVKAILAPNRIASSYKLYYCNHLIYSMYNFFNGTAYQNGYDSLHFDTEGAYDKIAFPKATDLHSANVVKKGTKITIAEPTIDYMTVTGYTDGTNNYSFGQEIEVNKTMTLKPIKSYTEYTIKFFDGTTELTTLALTYTAIDKLTLPEYTPTGEKVFDGWYDNSMLTGTAVTSIAYKTNGNKEFYAKVTDGNPLVDEVVVNGSWSTKTNGDKVTYNTKEYTIGLDAVSSLALSLDRINDGATIIIAPGTYNETLTLTKPVTIKGPNANATGTVSGSSDALLTGTITIGSDNITFDGVDFAGDTDSIIVLSDKAYSNLSFNHIYSTANPVTLNKVTDYADTVTNISSSSNYKRKAVIFVQRSDSAKTITNFSITNSMFFTNGDENSCVVLLNNRPVGFTVENNFFANGKTSIVENEAIIICRVGDILNINNNVFEWSTAKTTLAIGVTTSSSNNSDFTLNMKSNEFDGCANGIVGISVNTIRSNSIANIQDNSFINAENSTAMFNFRNIQSSSKLQVNMSYNFFDTTTALSIYKKTDLVTSSNATQFSVKNNAILGSIASGNTIIVKDETNNNYTDKEIVHTAYITSLN